MTDAALAESKAFFRVAALERRAAAGLAAGPDAAQRFADLFLASIALLPGAAVAGYVTIRDELDPLPLLAALAARGHPCLLPVVATAAQPLLFRRWQPGDPLSPGRFRVPEPLAESPESRPDIVIVPLVAFDRGGRRMGYGAGFYDRTLAALRAEGPVLAVGAGFAGQEAADVPAGPEDQPLDWIVTDQAAWRTAP